MSASDPVWISVDEAFAKLKAAKGGDQLASHALYLALKSGSLRSIGRQIKTSTAYVDDSADFTEIVLQKEIWFGAKFSSHAKPSGKLWFRIPELFARGGSWYIFVDGSEIEKMISPNTANRQAAENNKGGAPEKHNWAAAFAYCGWWVANNGLPSQKAQLVDVVERWFKEVDGGTPRDGRDLQRRVSRAYDELARLGRATKGEV